MNTAVALLTVVLALVCAGVLALGVRLALSIWRDRGAEREMMEADARMRATLAIMDDNERLFRI